MRVFSMFILHQGLFIALEERYCIHFSDFTCFSYRYDSDIGTETDSDFDSDDSEAEERRKKKAAKRKAESKPRESKPKKARTDVGFYFGIKFCEVPSFILALLNGLKYSRMD